MNSDHGDIVTKVRDFFTEKINTHGATPAGVDWNSADSQVLRFRELLRVCPEGDFSLIDYGCGYGALVQYLEETGVNCAYQGFDVSEVMIQHAHDVFGPDTPSRSFSASLEPGASANITVASGIFNMKLDVPEQQWETYIKSTLEHMASLSTRGFSFNMLTGYVDEDRKRPDLYYASATHFFEYCRRFSKRVALVHDYPLWEFTILVRLD
jgi:SAM-dependent methyltransferase